MSQPISKLFSQTNHSVNQSIRVICSTTAVVFLLLFLLFISEIDLVGEVVVKVDIRFSGERVLGDGLEGLLHVDRLFCRGLKVWNVACVMAPLLGALDQDLTDNCWQHLTESQSMNKKDNYDELLHIDRLLCRGLKVWNVTFGMAPLLGIFAWHFVRVCFKGTYSGWWKQSWKECWRPNS